MKFIPQLNLLSPSLGVSSPHKSIVSFALITRVHKNKLQTHRKLQKPSFNPPILYGPDVDQWVMVEVQKCDTCKNSTG